MPVPPSSMFWYSSRRNPSRSWKSSQTTWRGGRRSRMGTRLLQILHEPRHASPAVVYVLVLVETKSFQILEEFPNHMASGARVFKRHFKLLASAHQLGISNRLLVELLVGDAF